MAEGDAVFFGHFHGVFDAYLAHEHVVDAEGCGEVVVDMVGHLICRVAGACAVLAHIGRLVGGVVGRFALEEICAAVFAVPQLSLIHI